MGKMQSASPGEESLNWVNEAQANQRARRSRVHRGPVAVLCRFLLLHRMRCPELLSRPIPIDRVLQNVLCSFHAISCCVFCASWLPSLASLASSRCDRKAAILNQGPVGWGNGARLRHYWRCVGLG